MVRDRTCERCDRPFVAKRPHGKFCSDKCRSAEWKDARRDATQLSLERVLVRRSRSGRQLSYRKAVEAVAIYVDLLRDPARVMWSQPTAPADLVAEAILWPALPERQRCA